MPFIGALIGFITVSLSIAVMTFLQGMYDKDGCEKSRTHMLIIMMLAIAGSIAIFITEWMPLVPSPIRAAVAGGISVLTIAIIMLGVSYVAWKQKHQDCYKAQMYNWIFAVFLLLLGIITTIFTVI